MPVEGIRFDGNGSGPGGVTALLGADGGASRAGPSRGFDGPLGLCLAAPGPGLPAWDLAALVLLEGRIG